MKLTFVYKTPRPRDFCFEKVRRRPKMVPLNDILKLNTSDYRFKTSFFGDYAINGDESYEEILNYALYAFAHEDNPNKSDDFYNDVFATVHFVAEGSPAHDAGLRENDQLVQFDYIHIGNYTDTFQLRKIVKQAYYKIINIQVRRGNNKVWIAVSPRTWEKPGLIGCQIMNRWGRASTPRWPLVQ
ncbi:uncharacterized protein LOC126777266 isoform X2 [Nymphalis io]|uniref:uncharacterized protein LOC126777266 isoform X2 n=1 Tax=Inachis io TaxID=171585 RepID=UPI0021685FAF|nr:uncharacterized protein LOC126777266 isoform X2 [Nymphalis io]